MHSVTVVTARLAARDRRPGSCKGELLPQSLGVRDNHHAVVSGEQTLSFQLADDSRHGLSGGADRIGELLMGDLTGGRTARPHHGEGEEMAEDPLTDMAEHAERGLVQDVIDVVAELLSHRHADLRVALTQLVEDTRVEPQLATVGNGVELQRVAPSGQTGEASQVPLTQVGNRKAPAVAAD